MRHANIREGVQEDTMPRLRHHISIVLTAVLLILFPLHAWMQDVCPPLVVQALEEVGNNCSDLSKNSACYGFNRVEATFTQVVEDDFFSRPADIAEIVNLN